MIDKMDKKGERKTGHFFAPILTPAGVRMDSLPILPSYQLHKTTYTPPKYPTPNSKYQTPNTKSQTPNTKSQTPNTKSQTPNTKSQTPNPKHQTPNPKHYLTATTTCTIPNVKRCLSTFEKPASLKSFTRSTFLSKSSTESGRYSYAIG